MLGKIKLTSVHWKAIEDKLEYKIDNRGSGMPDYNTQDCGGL